MNCDEIRDLILDYIFEELPKEKLNDFERHISQCEICRTRLTELDGTYKILLKDSVPEPDEVFWNKFNKNLFTKIEQKKQDKKIIPFPFKKVFAIAASIIVIILTSFYLQSFKNVNLVNKLEKNAIVESKQPDSSKEGKAQSEILYTAFNGKNDNDSILIDTYIASADKDEESTFLETFDEISNFTHLSDFSTIGEDDESITDELVDGIVTAYNADLSDVSPLNENESSMFLSPEILIDDLYDDYMDLSGEEKQIFEQKLDKVKS